MITPKEYQVASTLFNLEVELIQTVAAVEGKGEGMLGKVPLILFEPHIFWKQLNLAGKFPKDYFIEGKVNTKYADILYKDWKPGAYGSVAKQHDRMERAAEIDRESALKSASWGMFQIMGFNWELTGCKSLQEFININYGGEAGQLSLFLKYLEKTKLDRALRSHDWRGFAFGYNGRSYEANNYHVKLEKTYKRLKGIL